MVISTMVLWKGSLGTSFKNIHKFTAKCFLKREVLASDFKVTVCKLHILKDIVVTQSFVSVF